MHRRVLAEVPLETDRPDARVGSVEALERGKRAVGGAVVDIDDLEGPPERLEGCNRSLVELVERVRLVVQRGDDGQRGVALLLAARVDPSECVRFFHECGSVSRSAGLARLVRCRAGRG